MAAPHPGPRPTVYELPRSWSGMRRDWGVLTFYQRFESVVGLLLTLSVAVVIVLALFRLCGEVVSVLILDALNPLDHAIFQRVFGNIMTLLIALEFNHTLRYVNGERGIIQARTVVLIAVLALARKIIITDLHAATPASLAALGALALSLGVTYRLMGNGPLRLPRPRPPGGRHSNRADRLRSPAVVE
jgi:uncharacterized membrane protein (DUF373 family)